MGRRKAGSAIVKHANNIAGFDVALLGVLWVDSDLLASMHFVAARHRRRVHLAMQTITRLVRDQMQRPARRRSAAKPFRRSKPCGVRRAVGIAEFRYRFGSDLNPAGGGSESMKLRVTPKLVEQYEVIRR